MKSREKVLDLLSKLQTMADTSRSNSPEESAVAAAQMQKIMFQHKISMAEISNFSDEEEDPVSKFDVMENEANTQVVTWKRNLLGGIARSNFCRVVCQSATRERKTLYRVYPAQKGAMFLYGRQGDMDTVLYLYAYLKNEVERLAKQESQYVRGSNKKSWANAFRMGCVLTISQRLKETRMASEQTLTPQSCALVKREDAAVASFMNKDCPHTRNAPASSIANLSGYASGCAAGKNIRLESGNKKLGRPAPQIGQ